MTPALALLFCALTALTALRRRRAIRAHAGLASRARTAQQRPGDPQ
jgi:hypothetical protein